VRGLQVLSLPSTTLFRVEINRDLRSLRQRQCANRRTIKTGAVLVEIGHCAPPFWVNVRTTVSGHVIPQV
jgi:hypothetical protein